MDRFYKYATGFFFCSLSKEFKNKGYELILTCRNSGNTVDLLEQNNLPFHIIGEKVNKGIAKKLLSFPKRIFTLYVFIKKNRPDIAASQSSFYQPIVAYAFKYSVLVYK